MENKMSDLGDESIEMAQLSEPSAGHRRSSSDRGVLLTPTVSPTKPKSFSSLQVPPDSSVKMTDDNKTPSKDSSHSGVTLEADEFDLEQPVVNKSRLSNFGLPSFLSSTSTPLNQSGLFGHLRRSSTTSGNNPQPPTSKVKSEFDVEKGLAAGNKASEGISIFSRIRPSGASKRGGKMSSTTQNSEDKKSAVAPNRLSKDTLKPLQLSPAAAPSKSEVNELEMMTEPRLSHEIQVSEEQIQPMRIGYEPDFPAEIPSRSRALIDESLGSWPFQSPPSEMRMPFMEKQPQHNFLLDAKDLQQTEANLLQLLNNFNSGKLRAFVNPDMLERMRNVREQQERLARLQFDLYAEQERLGVQTDEARKLADSNLAKLTDGLRQLNTSM